MALGPSSPVVAVSWFRLCASTCACAGRVSGTFVCDAHPATATSCPTLAVEAAHDGLEALATLAVEDTPTERLVVAGAAAKIRSLAVVARASVRLALPRAVDTVTSHVRQCPKSLHWGCAPGQGSSHTVVVVGSLG